MLPELGILIEEGLSFLLHFTASWLQAKMTAGFLGAGILGVS